MTYPTLLDETGQKILAAISRIKNKLLGMSEDPVDPGTTESSGRDFEIQDSTGREIISALNDLGDAVPSGSNPLSVAAGGTGATTASGAAANLGFATGKDIGSSGISENVVNIHIPNSSRHLIMLSSVTSGYHAMSLISANSTGSMYGLEIATGSSLARSTSTNTLTYTKADYKAVRVYDLVLYGDAASLS